jgi:ABC-2 type transport system permease protein
MNKLWLVIRREFIINVTKPGFLLSALGVPVLFAAIILFAVLIFSPDDGAALDSLPIGVVDRSGMLDAGATYAERPDLFVEYESEQTARAALDDGALEGYMVLAEDYRATGTVRLFSYEGISDDLLPAIDELLVANLQAEINSAVPPARLVEPAVLTVRFEDTGREISEDNIASLFIVPLLFYIVMLLAIQVAGAYLMSGLVEERANRVIEVLITSMTPMQLLLGKVIGLGLLGLVQLGVWAVIAAIAVSLSDRIAFLSGVIIPVDLLVFAFVYFILGYLLLGSVLIAVGAVVDNEQESRQLAGLVSLPLSIPIYFSFVFISDPNGPVATALSLFPFTAPAAMIIRMGFAPVPEWQIAVSIALLVLSGLFFAWAGARIFRWGLLLYGKSFNLREVISVVRGQPVTATPAPKSQEVTA